MLDFTKPIQTLDGRKVTIFTTQAVGDFPIVGQIEDSNGVFTWSASGKFDPYDEAPEYDLVNVKTKNVAWLNIYSDHGGSFRYASKEEADKHASNTRIACVKIEYEEGEGL